MKKLYGFSQNLMNGTVTLRTEVALFTSEELAKKAKEAVIEVSKDVDFPRLMYGEIKETVVYESEDEVPILNSK